MPELAPCTSRVSPRFRAPAPNTFAYTVNTVSGKAAARRNRCHRVRVLDGIGRTRRASTAANSAVAAAAEQGAHTIADALNARIDSSITPATSMPSGPRSARWRTPAVALHHILSIVDTRSADPDQHLAVLGTGRGPAPDAVHRPRPCRHGWRPRSSSSRSSVGTPWTRPHCAPVALGRLCCTSRSTRHLKTIPT